MLNRKLLLLAAVLSAPAVVYSSPTDPEPVPYAPPHDPSPAPYVPPHEPSPAPYVPPHEPSPTSYAPSEPHPEPYEPEPHPEPYEPEPHPEPYEPEPHPEPYKPEPHPEPYKPEPHPKPETHTAKPYHEPTATTHIVRPTVSCEDDRTVHAAVLFEKPRFGGIKHWIDGKIGECRGLSGAPVASIPMVAKPGADPFTDAVEDNVQIAFFDDVGCMGEVLGVVAGSNENTSSLIKQSNATKVFSARWVAPGVHKEYMNMQFDGKSNPDGSGAGQVSLSGLAGLFAAAVAYFV